jgi:hypothetical protein
VKDGLLQQLRLITGYILRMKESVLYLWKMVRIFLLKMQLIAVVNY